MMQRIALVDWDGTIRRDFTIREWFGQLCDAGLLPARASIKLDDLMSQYRKEIICHDDLARMSANVYAIHLKGSSKESVRQQARIFVSSDQKLFFPWSRDLLETVHKHQVAIVVISGAPAEVLEQYGQSLKFETVYGLDLETRGGLFTGKVKRNPGVSETKQQLVQQFTNTPTKRIVFAMGDSPSDNPLFSAAPVNIIVNNSALKTEGHEFHIDEYMSNERILRIVEDIVR